MALERVAELVRRAAHDTGVLHALKNDPAKLRSAFNLTGAHLDALNSATAFPLPDRAKSAKSAAAAFRSASTKVGAEGLTTNDGEFCALADDPAGFAERVIALLRDPERAAEMAERARAEVVANWDMGAITGKLVEGYREIVREKRS